MSDIRQRPNPLVFLSSTVNGDVAVPLGLKAMRERLYLHGCQYGPNSVWVDEYSQPRPPDSDPFEAIDDFLGELDRSRLYLALVGTDWPGSSITLSGNESNVTFFEIELFYAALLGRQIAVICRTDIPVPERTLDMLALLKRILSDVQWYEVSSEKKAEAKAVELIDRAASGKTESLRMDQKQYGHLLQLWWQWREPTASIRPFYWLDEKFPSARRTPKATVVAEALRLASDARSEGLRMSRIWIAAKELMGAPYWQETDVEWLPQWKEVLSAWNSAAAWYGLHGHLQLGYLPALHSLVKVCEIGQTVNDGTDRGDSFWSPPTGSLASAYYALARRVPDRAQRNIGLSLALTLIDQAVSSDPIGRSNVLAIRGSILREQHQFRAAVDTYREVLRLRESAQAPEGAIGEALSELGFGLLFTLRLREGRALLKEGVALMERANYRPGFVVRAKRKLAVASLVTGHVLEAKGIRDEATRLADVSGVGRVTR